MTVIAMGVRVGWKESESKDRVILPPRRWGANFGRLNKTQAPVDKGILHQIAPTRLHALPEPPAHIPASVSRTLARMDLTDHH